MQGDKIVHGCASEVFLIHSVTERYAIIKCRVGDLIIGFGVFNQKKSEQKGPAWCLPANFLAESAIRVGVALFMS